MAKATKPAAPKPIVCDLSAIETQAIRRVIKDGAFNKSRDAFGPGLYPVDITVRISGNLKVGDNFEKAPTIRIPQKKVMALMLAKAGAIRPHLMKLMEECIGETIRMQLAAEATGEDTEKTVSSSLQEQYEAEYDVMVDQLCAGLPKIKERGHVLAELSMERITTLGEESNVQENS
jgi:hypothetical protein